MFEEILHHACLVVGDRRSVLEELKKSFGAAAIYESYDSFGIADSRLLKERQSRKVAIDARRIFVLDIAAITLEAQQALLKTFEEPGPGNHFFIITSSENLFLPTLRSRFEIIHYPARQPESGADQASGDFLSALPEKRLAIVGSLLETAEKKGNDLIFDFFNNLEVQVARGRFKLPPQAKIKACQQLKRARNFIRQRAGAPRLVLEHLALVLPNV